MQLKLKKRHQNTKSIRSIYLQSKISFIFRTRNLTRTSTMSGFDVSPPEVLKNPIFVPQKLLMGPGLSFLSFHLDGWSYGWNLFISQISAMKVCRFNSSWFMAQNYIRKIKLSNSGKLNVVLSWDRLECLENKSWTLHFI